MTTRLLAFDASVRSYDADGRLRIASAPISKEQVAPYLGKEIPSPGLDPDAIYYMLRPADELAKAASTFDGVPILLSHSVVSAADPKKELVVGSVGPTTFDGVYLNSSLSFWDGKAIKLIEDNEQKQLSAAYRYAADMTPGTFGGQRYDGVMRNLRANHLALVQTGRAGADVCVGDSALEENPMADEPTPTSVATMMSFLKGILSDEEFQELAAVLKRSSDSEALVLLKAAEMAHREATTTGSPVGRMAGDAAVDATSYRAALNRMGVKVDPSFGLPVLRAMYKARTRPSSTPAAQKSFDERFPKAASVSWAHRTR